MPPKPRKRAAKAATPSRVPLTTLAVLAVGAAAVLLFSLRDRPTPGTTTADRSIPAAAPTAAYEAPDPAVDAFIAPDLPPLPLHLGPPSRPTSVVKAVYEFAARHPEVLRYVPCFCGCEHDGHAANDDCFVASRDAEGRVSWDAHGMT